MKLWTSIDFEYGIRQFDHVNFFFLEFMFGISFTFIGFFRLVCDIVHSIKKQTKIFHCHQIAQYSKINLLKYEKNNFFPHKYILFINYIRMLRQII